MKSIRRLIGMIVALRAPLYYLGFLMLCGLLAMMFRSQERMRLPSAAEAVAKEAGYRVAAFHRVVRVGRQWAVACGSADGHLAIYGLDGPLRVADRDPRVGATYARYCK